MKYISKKGSLVIRAIPIESNGLSNVYKMSGRSVSVHTDTSASHQYTGTLIQNGHEFCKLLIKRPQSVMFSNYI